MTNSLQVSYELSLLDLKTPASMTAAEIIEFLAGDPSPQEILNYHVSTRAQERLQHLLDLNDTGLLTIDQEHELDEVGKIEHCITMLKAQIAGQNIGTIQCSGS
jgi:hypothetical protein